MEIKKAQGAIEAVLFASGDPVSLEKLSEALEIDPATTDKLVRVLEERYNIPESGIQIVRLEDGVQMCSNPGFAAEIRRVMEIRRNTPLSPAALEVLAVVAYNQPVTKAFIEQVRGVDCSGVVSSLMAKNLIEERGRLELPGRPLLYGTTQDFLRCMQISSLSELRPVPGRGEEGQEDEQNTGAQTGESA